MPHSARSSLYKDDLVIFLSPKEQDFLIIWLIFDSFSGASDLACNVTKTQMVAIRCDGQQKHLASTLFPCQEVDFPIRYLGVLLSTHKLPRLVFHPMIDRMANKLHAWKGDLMNRSHRLALIKSTLSTMSIHTAISVELPPWAVKAMNQIMKGFQWMGSNVVHGGKCIVAWSRVQRLLDLGSLGITDLNILGWVLQARWLWLQHTQPTLPWITIQGATGGTVATFF
jgi:hypothetical protein